MADYGSMFLVEELRLDGSNFADWLMRLRETLFNCDQLFVIDEPIGETPDLSASHEEYMEWLELKTTYLKVEWMMCACMENGFRFRTQRVITPKSRGSL